MSRFKGMGKDAESSVIIIPLEEPWVKARRVKEKFLKLVIRAYVHNFNEGSHVLPRAGTDDFGDIGSACWYKCKIGQVTYRWVLGQIESFDYTVQPPSFGLRHGDGQAEQPQHA